jgi:hypothetical protein
LRPAGRQGTREQKARAEAEAANDDAGRRLRAGSNGAGALDVQACLAKPFDLDVLVGAVQRLLRTD